MARPLEPFLPAFNICSSTSQKDGEALLFANKAVSLAESLHDTELLEISLYKRSRVHMVQNKHDLARADIKSTLDKVKRAKASLKGSTYLLAAEVNSIYAGSDDKLKTKCRTWQENASKLLYNGKVEEVCAVMPSRNCSG